MGLFKRIRDFFEQNNIEELETEKREQELIEQIKHIRNINIFNVKKIGRINTLEKININKMNANQLKNTYLYIKKSIKEAENNNYEEDILKLKEIKANIKQLLLEKSNTLDFASIKTQILYGDINNLDYYHNYLLKCYEKYKNVKYNTEAQQIRITINTLIKLIDMRKKKINDKNDVNITKKKILNIVQFVKKVA